MNEELTPEQTKSIEDTVARRDKFLELMREAHIKRLKQLGKLIKEKERTAANKKAENRKKGKASKKSRKRNR